MDEKIDKWYCQKKKKIRMEVYDTQDWMEKALIIKNVTQFKTL